MCICIFGAIVRVYTHNRDKILNNNKAAIQRQRISGATLSETAIKIAVPAGADKKIIRSMSIKSSTYHKVGRPVFGMPHAFHIL